MGCQQDLWSVLFLMGAILGFPFLISRISFLIEQHYKIKISLFAKDLMFVTFIMFLITTNSAIGNLERDRRKANYFSFEIKYKNGYIFKSDSNHLFLGKTKSYVFIYNYYEKTSEVIRDELIEKILFQK